jgi:hypothetical protein
MVSIKIVRKSIERERERRVQRKMFGWMCKSEAD